MAILFNTVGGFVVEVGKFVSKCIHRKIENVVRFSSKNENLREGMEKLKNLKDDIKGKVEEAERAGCKVSPSVLKWLDDVHELENEWEIMQESIAAAKKLAYKCCPNCSLHLKVSTQARNIRDQLCRLIETEVNFSNLVVEHYRMKKIEFIPGPSMEGQSTARRNLNEILQLLEDDKVRTIGVWGTGGVGKTTLVMNLLNTYLPRSKLSFDFVVWIVVSKATDIREVQERIASGLDLKVDSEASVESIASKIYERLKEAKSFLLILDDVWEPINLDDLGVPQPEDPTRSKIIITSRSLDVCKQMKADIEMQVYPLDEDESWQLFVKNAGDVANLEHIQPLAKEIAKECGGLPLEITIVAKSMRGKTRVELWEDALRSLRMSKSQEIYNPIKWSFDSLGSPDIQNCFLYCSLYPAAIPTDDLIHCWWAEGFLGQHDTYEQAYNRGIEMVESLKDRRMLEAHEKDYLKMHDVARDFAISKANSSRNEHNSIIQAGVGLAEISHIKVSSSLKRISFVSNRIQRLPDNFTKCPETTSLLLQNNEPLEEIPHDFFLAFPDLRVLNLSRTRIRALPSSLNSLCQLRVLILQNCHMLTELPPIGDLCNLQVLDCDDTGLDCLPQGMDKLKNLRLLNLPVSDLKSISKGFFLKLSSLEMLKIHNKETLLGPTSFDEISSLHNLTSLFVRVNSSAIFNKDHTWMSRLKRFHIEVGERRMAVPFNKSTRMIGVSHCEIFSKGELLGMLHFASHLYLEDCTGLRKLFAYKSFDGLKSLHINSCSCNFGPMEEGSGIFDPLPNLEYLNLQFVYNLKSVSDFSQLLGLRFSKLRQLDISFCERLTCLFNIGGVFSVPKHLEDISITFCPQLVELLVQCSSRQAILVNSEIPRVRKLYLGNLPKFVSLGEPLSMWEHLEEHEVINCDRIEHGKLPLSIRNSNIKVRKGLLDWWSA